MVRPILLTLALQAALVTVQAGPAPQDLAAAGAALEAGKYAEAATLLEKAVAADPNDYRARFNLAFAYTQLHRDSDAIEQYTKVAEQQPDLTPARLNLGILLLRQNQAAGAVPHLQAAAEKKPQDFRTQFYLSEALLGSGLNQRASDAYRKALEIDPKSAPAVLGLARSLARDGRLDEAREQYVRAAQMDPQFSDALLELGDLLEKQQKPAEALDLYLEFLKAKPNMIAVEERAGFLLLQLKRYPEAIEHLDAAVKQNATPANQAALAQAYAMTKEWPKAIPLLRAAIAAEPADADLHYRLGMALMESSDFAAASREFLATVEKQPNNMPAWNGLGFTLYRVENFDGALKALDHARQLGPEPPGNHFIRAIILDKFRQYPEARDAYQKYLESSGGKDPDDEFKARQRIRIITNMLNKHR